MGKNNPKISVVMAVYNTEKFVWQAIESILHQSFSDFEMIIIDDASTDNSWGILQKFAKKDERIKIFQNKKNLWIAKTRQKLINLTNSDYIATMDSDDISTVHRLEKSYNFLKQNYDYAVVSGNTEIIDEKNQILGYRKYSEKIAKNILKKSPIAQWASMFRKKIFEEVNGYDEDLNFGEDYDLWCKMYSKWYKIKNLDNFLLKVRIRQWQTKIKNLKETLKNTIFIQKRAMEKYQIKPDFSDKIYHFLEKILLFFPDFFIFWLFQKYTYSQKYDHRHSHHYDEQKSWKCN